MCWAGIVASSMLYSPALFIVFDTKVRAVYMLCWGVPFSVGSFIGEAILNED